MVQVTQEERRGAEIDYGGDPPAPTGARERVVQFFDDGTHRVVIRAIAIEELGLSWAAAIAAQRDALAASAGEGAARIAELEAENAFLKGLGGGQQ